MAQYDLVLLQNRANPGPEFEEYLLTGVRGGVVAFDGATIVPTVISGGSQNDVLQIDADGDAIWGSVPGGSHNAVTLASSAAILLDVSGGQELSLDTWTEHYFLAGPLSGGAAVPTIRAMHIDDVPDLSSLYHGTFTPGNLTETTSAVLSISGTGVLVTAGTIEVNLATPSNSDTTHLSTADQIFDFVNGGYQPLGSNLTSLDGLTYVSSSFVKMTGANTFSLDTNTYLTSSDIATLPDIGDVSAYSSIAAGELLEWSGSAWVHQTVAELGLAEYTGGDLTDEYIPKATGTRGQLEDGYQIQTTITDVNTHLPTSGAVVDYIADGLAAADAMIFKGTVGSGGTLTLAAHDALTTYNAGWTYRVIEASSDLWGKVVEIGDLIIAIVDRTGSGNTDADWTVAQTNLDGAVLEEDFGTNYTILRADVSGTPTELVVGASTIVGRAAAGGIVALSASDARTVLGLTAIYVEEANFTAQTILAAISNGDPQPLTIAEETLVGRVTSGDVDALIADLEVMPMMWRTLVPATSTSTGTRGQIHEDDNYLYICTATDVWKRCALATTWT